MFLVFSQVCSDAKKANKGTRKANIGFDFRLVNIMVMIVGSRRFEGLRGLLRLLMQFDQVIEHGI